MLLHKIWSMIVNRGLLICTSTNGVCTTRFDYERERERETVLPESYSPLCSFNGRMVWWCGVHVVPPCCCNNIDIKPLNYVPGSLVIDNGSHIPQRAVGNVCPKFCYLLWVSSLLFYDPDSLWCKCNGFYGIVVYHGIASIVQLAYSLVIQ